MPDSEEDAIVRDTCAILIVLVRAMVDDPDAVSAEPIHKQSEVCFRLQVAKNDVGKVIGRQGRTGRSIRVILRAIAITHKQNFTLDIVE